MMFISIAKVQFSQIGMVQKGLPVAIGTAPKERRKRFTPAPWLSPIDGVYSNGDKDSPNREICGDRFF